MQLASKFPVVAPIKRCFSSAIVLRNKKDDSWKYKTNYFNNAWNRQTYGPVDRRIGQVQETPDDNESYWTESVQNQIKYHNDRTQHYQQTELEKCISEATDFLSSQPTSSLPTISEKRSKIRPAIDRKNLVNYEVPNSLLQPALDENDWKLNKELTKTKKATKRPKRSSSNRTKTGWQLKAKSVFFVSIIQYIKASFTMVW